jgi:hypothetical protein
MSNLKLPIGREAGHQGGSDGLTGNDGERLDIRSVQSLHLVCQTSGGGDMCIAMGPQEF